MMVADGVTDSFVTPCTVCVVDYPDKVAAGLPDPYAPGVRPFPRRTKGVQ